MDRSFFYNQIDFQFKIHSVCGLLGPRQVGKTTLAKQYAQKYNNVHFFDLENPLDLARLENPMLALMDLQSDLIVIDEIQRRPELFPVLRVLVDERPRKFLILGSASRDLLQQSSETLAGRIGYIELTTFSVSEGAEEKKLWLQGGFPLSYLASSNEESYAWRQAYITTFLERDIPSLGFNIPPMLMRRLWMMVAHYHGQILNATEIGKSLSLSHHTVRKYLDILSGTFMIRLLTPWFENIGKRQVKSPKIYLRDSGLLHALVGIQDAEQLQVYPRLGSSWEGFALEEIIKEYRAAEEECYFWATQAGAELDLLIIKDGKKIGFEFKYTDAPKATLSMRIAIETLKLDHLYIVFPYKEDSFPLSEKITARGLQEKKM
ncbi:MAG: ATP-binding protein [Candidatus Amoebophilus sp.]